MTLIEIKPILDTGLRGLWLGQTGTFIREKGGTAAAWFGTKEHVASLLLARRSHHRVIATVRPWELAFSGACSVAACNLALFPADSVKRVLCRRRKSFVLSRRPPFEGSIPPQHPGKQHLEGRLRPYVER